MQIREFDLNIEKVLENWDVSHAVREIIANAIDEQILTNSKDIVIFSIMPFGRYVDEFTMTRLKYSK